MTEDFVCKTCNRTRPGSAWVEGAAKPKCTRCWTIEYYELAAPAVAKVEAEVLGHLARGRITPEDQYTMVMAGLLALAKKVVLRPPDTSGGLSLFDVDGMRGPAAGPAAGDLGGIAPESSRRSAPKKRRT